MAQLVTNNDPDIRRSVKIFRGYISTDLEKLEGEFEMWFDRMGNTLKHIDKVQQSITDELRDGYGIFLTYACTACEDKKLAEFRPDIIEQYDTDKQIEEENQ